jgi:hypothetical protein
MEQMETPIRVKKEGGSTGSGDSERGDAHQRGDQEKGSAPNIRTDGSGENSDGDDAENPSGHGMQSGMNDDVSLTFPQRVSRTAG